MPVIFLILKQWGLQDINHIQKFFGYDRTIFNVYLANFRAVFRPYGVVIDCCESGCDWQRLGGYARFILERKGEKHFVKVFSRLSLNPWNEYDLYMTAISLMEITQALLLVSVLASAIIEDAQS